jgi:hypothetical protein
MSHNRNIEELINAFVFSFIITMILITARDVIKLLNDEIDKINDEIKRLNTVIEDNNLKHNFHLKEIEASYNTKLDDFQVKYNSDILAVNANIVSRITAVSRCQDETIEKVLNIQDTTIGEMLDAVDELNGQMSAVQFNISSIMGHRNEYNNFINNELVAIRGKINELESEMPVCIGTDGQDNHDIFIIPKNVKNMLNFGRQGCCDLNIDVLNKFPTLTHVMISFYNKIIIKGNPKALQDLSNEDKAYIKGRCDENGITLINSPF